MRRLPRPPLGALTVVLAATLAISACSRVGGQAGADAPASESPGSEAVAAVDGSALPRAAPNPPARIVGEQPWTPFATVAGITLHHPATRVERVGFHQSNHEGARQLTVLPGAVSPLTLESRDRLTDSRTAADVVVHPATEIRAPVTGVVKRAGTYVLYCDHSDDYAVIAPDEAPAWEVKLLHIDGVQVAAGERVVAGETLLAPRATQLPFESQVDELSRAATAWPHVHIEVVDPSIPNRPSPGGGC